METTSRTEADYFAAISRVVSYIQSSLDEVVTVLLLGAPHQRTIPREMFSGLRDSLNPMIAVIATLLTALAVLLLLVIEWLRARNERLRRRARPA